MRTGESNNQHLGMNYGSSFKVQLIALVATDNTSTLTDLDSSFDRLSIVYNEVLSHSVSLDVSEKNGASIHGDTDDMDISISKVHVTRTPTSETDTCCRYERFSVFGFSVFGCDFVEFSPTTRILASVVSPQQWRPTRSYSINRLSRRPSLALSLTHFNTLPSTLSL